MPKEIRLPQTGNMRNRFNALSPGLAAIMNEFIRTFDRSVLFEDKALLVVNKPAGVAVHPQIGGVPAGVSDIFCLARGHNVSPVHRLDMGTSGILLAGKSPGVRDTLRKQFETHTVKKTYVALVDGHVPPKLSGIVAPVDVNGKRAATAFTPIAYFEDGSGQLKTLVQLVLLTGRTHQIRIHMRNLQFPVTGDPQYNPLDGNGLKHQLLHAYQIRMLHPVTGEEMTIRAGLPDDFLETIDSLMLLSGSRQFDEVVKTV